jgi:hypothetical protein
LEVIRRIEQGLDLSQGTLEERIQKRSISMKLSPDIPDQMIHYPPMVSWEITPVDNQFEQIAPAGREGAIDFSTTLLHNEKAWVAAKAYTLSAHGHLPQVIFHEVNNLEKDVKQRVSVWTWHYIKELRGTETIRLDLTSFFISFYFVFVSDSGPKSFRMEIFQILWVRMMNGVKTLIKILQKLWHWSQHTTVSTMTPLFCAKAFHRASVWRACSQNFQNRFLSKSKNW